jgi:hypothetical protein
MARTLSYWINLSSAWLHLNECCLCMKTMLSSAPLHAVLVPLFDRHDHCELAQGTSLLAQFLTILCTSVLSLVADIAYVFLFTLGSRSSKNKSISVL